MMSEVYIVNVQEQPTNYVKTNDPDLSLRHKCP
jgi:hypothetical protein